MAYDERKSEPAIRYTSVPLGKDIELDPRFSDLMRRIGLQE